MLKRQEFRATGLEPTAALLVKFWATAAVSIAVGIAGLAWYKGVFASPGRPHSLTMDSRASDDEADFLGDDYSRFRTQSERKEDDDKEYAIDATLFSVRFRCSELEEQFERAVIAERVALGSTILAFTALLLLLIRMFMAFGRIVPCRTMRVPGLSIMFPALIFIIGISVRCAVVPNERLYASALAIFCIFAAALELPPFGMSCYDLKERCKSYLFESRSIYEAYFHCDCSLQGQLAMQLYMTLLFIFPWCAVRMDYMHALWLWIFGVWLFLTLLYRFFTEETVFTPSEVGYATVLLCLMLLLATRSRRHHELARRANFVEDMKKRQWSRRMFCVLEYMMPAHVIGPLLKNPQAHIADQISRVSILFVVIAHFDRFTGAMTPSQLLKFLNETFTQMDRLCYQNQVTKIETVGEEYVACVGVTPQDMLVGETNGHGFLLERLFQTGGEILGCQTGNVKFKMGVHTGPIVAGVIGTKLPRHRLFGDTINMAARMMQKAVDGELQFGAETMSDLPTHLAEQVTGPRDVEMKGKGAVPVYSYAPSGGSSSSGAQLHPAARGRFASDMDSLAQGGVRKRSSIVDVIAGSQMMRNTTSSAMPMEEKRTEARFNAALESVNDEETKDQRGWSLRSLFVIKEKEGFTQEMEKQWLQQFHNEFFCVNARKTFGRFCILTTILTCCELVFLIWYRVWRFPHQAYSRHFRWVVFIYCRFIIMFIGIAWWLLAETHKRVKRRPRVTQLALLITCCIWTLLMYISYDALTISQTTAYRHLSTHVVRAPRDLTLNLNFVIFFCVSTRMYQLPYYHTLVYIPVMALVLFSPLWFHAVFPTIGNHALEAPFSDEGVFLLLVQVCINAAIAHEVEQVSRSRFKAQRAVKLTEERTNYILGTLMPPLVMEEIRRNSANALPSHQYRHATIAQSDLCGFTQLSSTKKPTEVVAFMGELFGAFDRLTDKHSVYKVETIGDAYIAGMAEPPLTPTNSPVAVVLFGLDMVRAVDEWAKELGVKVACRVGVHYGECIGGIVGNDMQRYHLFGDLLTILDVMESTSIEGRVQVSEACKAEVERQLKDDAGASVETLAFVQRDGPRLQTSKGETHTFEEVGGVTYLTMSDHPLRRIH